MRDIIIHLLGLAETHPAWVGGVAGLSLLLFLGSLLLIPLILSRLPVDYFHRTQHIPLEHWQHRPLFQGVMLVLKNLSGGILLLAGLAMLLLPGQGLLTILTGLILIDFPGKHRLKRRLMTWPLLFRGVNHLRQRRGQPPFLF